MTHVGVGVNITVRVGQDQHVNVHGVQKGGDGGVGTVISGDLNGNKGNEFTLCTVTIHHAAFIGFHHQSVDHLLACTMSAHAINPINPI